MKRLMNNMLVLTALLLPFPLMAASAFDGTWKIDVSKIHGSGTAEVMTLKDGLYTCNCAPPIHIKADGTDQPISGRPDMDTMAVKVVNDHVVEQTAKKDGKVVFTRTYTVAPDGKTATFAATSDRGKHATFHGTLTRVGDGAPGSNALAGSWQIASYQSASENRLTSTYKVDGDTVTYYATYTAFDGSHVAPQLIETCDFVAFRVSQLAGPAAKNKGMALFPRKVGGRYAALSRWDRENNAVSFSDDGRVWETAVTIQTPHHPWNLIQLGNCGSPIETRSGWLVLIHGVGPMREYVMSAALLDLDDPTRVLGVLQEPLLVATESERIGYVPNVVYSCGALLHGDVLVVPYGCSDSSVRVATLHLPALLAQLVQASTN